MASDSKKKSIQQNLMEAITSGEIKMHSKLVFVLRAALCILGIAVLFVTLLYIASFIFYVVLQTGAWHVSAFGMRGWYALLLSLPWVLILLLLLFIFVLEMLVKHYSFVYRRPLLYSAAGILFIVLLGGHVVATTPLHGRFSHFAEANHVPVARQFYRAFGHRYPRNIHRGVITTTTLPGNFFIVDQKGELVNIVITNHTRLPFGADFSPGDMVVVFGERSDHTIEAIGVLEK